MGQKRWRLLNHVRDVNLGFSDFSKWFRSVIKDEALAAEAEQIERRGGRESRVRIRAAIEKRYTLGE